MSYHETEANRRTTIFLLAMIPSSIGAFMLGMDYLIHKPHAETARDRLEREAAKYRLMFVETGMAPLAEDLWTGHDVVAGWGGWIETTQSDYDYLTHFEDMPKDPYFNFQIPTFYEAAILPELNGSRKKVMEQLLDRLNSHQSHFGEALSPVPQVERQDKLAAIHNRHETMMGNKVLLLEKEKWQLNKDIALLILALRDGLSSHELDRLSNIFHQAATEWGQNLASAYPEQVITYGDPTQAARMCNPFVQV